MRIATGALRPRNDIFTYNLHTPYTLHYYVTLLCKHPLHQQKQAEARNPQDADDDGIEPAQPQR